MLAPSENGAPPNSHPDCSAPQNGAHQCAKIPRDENGPEAAHARGEPDRPAQELPECRSREGAFGAPRANPAGINELEGVPRARPDAADASTSPLQLPRPPAPTSSGSSSSGEESGTGSDFRIGESYQATLPLLGSTPASEDRSELVWDPTCLQGLHGKGECG